ncbi:MAG TPA: hypothetical protein PKA06_14990 [Gemmatales bacterium]|nr:hypothetical protein [Gemmatales bacterium]
MKSISQWLLTLMLAGVCGYGIYQWFEQYKIPTIRTEVAAPIYTVASPEDIQAISEGKAVVQFGPMPGNAYYAGGLAFRQPEEALLWLRETGKYEEGWRVYELSGDYEMDTHLVRGLPHTNKTLLFVKQVPI